MAVNGKPSKKLPMAKPSGVGSQTVMITPVACIM